MPTILTSIYPSAEQNSFFCLQLYLHYFVRLVLDTPRFVQHNPHTNIYIFKFKAITYRQMFSRGWVYSVPYLHRFLPVSKYTKTKFIQYDAIFLTLWNYRHLHSNIQNNSFGILGKSYFLRITSASDVNKPIKTP